MIVIELFIPLADNDGQGFTPSHHAAFEAALINLFGGFSKLPGAVTGGWADAGRVYHDDLVVYLVALGSIVEAGKVGEAANLAKSHYRQEAIFCRYLGLAEVL